MSLSNGVEIPKLVYGTAWKKERTSELVLKALQMGFRGIDTACQPKHYNEAGVGEALAQSEIPRDKLFVQTKFTPIDGQDPTRLPYDPKAALEDQVAQSFATSQKNLKTKFVDSLILHSPLKSFEDTLLVWKAMEKIHNAGGVKHIGISNCYELSVIKQLHEKAQVKPTFLQNRFYRETHYDRELREWCREKGIIYQGFWILTANPHVLQSAPLQVIAQSYHKTEAQVFFRFLMQEGIVPLTGTCSEEHMKEDLDVFDFTLTAKDLEAIALLL